MRDKLIDGFRAVAVLSVVAAHALSFRFPITGTVTRFADPLAEGGVQLFFVISGYIITTLLLREEERTGQVSILAFYIRRGFRILPPLLAYYAGLLVLRALGIIAFSSSSIEASAAFTCNTGLTNCQWFVAHTWSLAVEEQYYLAWPLLLTLLAPKMRVPFLTALIGLLLTCLLSLPAHWHSNWISFACIASGALYATSEGVRQAIQRMASAWLWIAAVALFGLGHVLFGASKWLAALNPALIPFILFGARELAFVKRLLESAPIQAVGLCSYSLYLWQQVFLGRPSQYAAELPLAALPVIAALSFFLIERPCKAIGHQLSRNVKTKLQERRAGAIIQPVGET